MASCTPLSEGRHFDAALRTRRQIPRDHEDLHTVARLERGITCAHWRGLSGQVLARPVAAAPIRGHGVRARRDTLLIARPAERAVEDGRSIGIDQSDEENGSLDAGQHRVFRRVGDDRCRVRAGHRHDVRRVGIKVSVPGRAERAGGRCQRHDRDRRESPDSHHAGGSTVQVASSRVTASTTSE
jgi:hypothetical protein